MIIIIIVIGCIGFWFLVEEEGWYKRKERSFENKGNPTEVED